MSAAGGAPQLVPDGPRGLTVAVGSGKGGVGKTSVVANLAIALARDGCRATLIDGDMGLASLDVLLGLTPTRTIEHFFREHVPLEDIAIEGPHGLRLIPGGSGLPELACLTAEELQRFVEALDGLRETNDIVLLDTAAGIGEGASRLWLLADRFLLVAWPEPTALVAAYAALKVLRRRGAKHDVGLVVNGVESEEEAQNVHQRLDAACQRFLDQRVFFDGFVMRDDAVADAARRRQALVQLHPCSPASQCIDRLAIHFAALAGRQPRGGDRRTWPRIFQLGEVVH